MSYVYSSRADYPKDQKSFNSIKMLPELFSKIDFRDFVLGLGMRAGDFFASELFLYSSRFQNNYGSKLVMLISAIERSNGRWRPLESILKSSKFKKQFSQSSNLSKAYSLLNNQIEEYLDQFGSTRSVIDFYVYNLSDNQKKELVNGIVYLHTYERTKQGNDLLLTPVNKKDPKVEGLDNIARINYLLSIRLKHVVYAMRNAFVHQAIYTPFPDRKLLGNKGIFRFTTGKEGLPHKDWIIRIPFERLHDLTRIAFANYWLKEYKKIQSKNAIPLAKKNN